MYMFAFLLCAQTMSVSNFYSPHRIALPCGSGEVRGSGQEGEEAYVEYLQKNFLPDEAVYKPKKKVKKDPKGLEKFYDEQGEEINEDSTDNGHALRGEE